MNNRNASTRVTAVSLNTLALVRTGRRFTLGKVLTAIRSSVLWSTTALGWKL